MKYITIDGDDIGRLITSSYLNDSEEQLIDISHNLNLSVKNIANLLEDRGFQILFCAADGVLAKTESDIDFIELFDCIQNANVTNFTFSAGVASSLKDAYVALLDAKCNGKNKIRIYG